MYPVLGAILEPPVAAASARRARGHDTFFECDSIPVITRRGRTLRVRAITSGDAQLLAALLASLSERSTQLRFFRPLRDITAIWGEVARVACGSQLHKAALVATV